MCSWGSSMNSSSTMFSWKRGLICWSFGFLGPLGMTWGIGGPCYLLKFGFLTWGSFWFFNWLLSSEDSLTISLSRAFIIVSCLASEFDDEVEACGSSSLTLLVSFFYLFLLDVVRFTSTSVASSIMSSKETKLLSLSNRVNSLLKASA